MMYRMRATFKDQNSSFDEEFLVQAATYGQAVAIAKSKALENWNLSIAFSPDIVVWGDKECS